MFNESFKLLNLVNFFFVGSGQNSVVKTKTSEF